MAGKSFDECFYDLLRALAADELASLKQYLQDSKGLISHEINDIGFKLSRIDDWQSTLQGELSRIEHKVKKYADQYGAMPFADFIDCIDSGNMADDMRSAMEGYLDKYYDLKYNLISATSIQTYWQNIDLYRKDLESRITEYIEAIDSILAEKLTGVF